ncbi:twin-arginine protein translocation system subunit TatC [Candidatus Tenderia electrophaga]|uniref:Sec-independent protein translocase protein TatC n=1 Tax=Candidatus Tenderia electrophaga TaxID=1748243 RepID=A0A0S2TIA1_9GAMM|nr:twin-arginine protein translocation system subunit TatC [Candidatus Tenderia electrophaga]
MGDRLNTRSTRDRNQEQQGLIGHLIELRSRLLRIFLSIGLIFLPLAFFANDLYALLAMPLLAHMPQGTSMIATEVASPFLTPFKFALVLAIFLGMPVILYHFWAFIAPGLYVHERKMMLPLLAGSTALFYGGVIFAYYVVFPLIFGFFLSVVPQGVAVMTDISKYLDFVLKIFFAFGLAFEVPIVTIVLVWAGATTPEQLVAKRPYVIVGAFVLGMLFTPPDMISQTLLAIPMWLLFEIGVVLSRMVAKRQAERDTAEEEQS